MTTAEVTFPCFLPERAFTAPGGTPTIITATVPVVDASRCTFSCENTGPVAVSAVTMAFKVDADDVVWGVESSVPAFVLAPAGTGAKTFEARVAAVRFTFTMAAPGGEVTLSGRGGPASSMEDAPMPGVSLPDTPQAVLLDAASPDTVVALDSSGEGTSLSRAQVLAMLFPVASIPLTSGVGWTDDVAGAGSVAAITGGEASLVTGVAGLLARIGRSVPWGATGARIYVRVSTPPPGVTDEFGLFLCNSTAGAATVGVTLYGNGDVQARNSVSNGPLVPVAGMIGGQGWLRLDAFAGGVDVYAAPGVDDDPPLEDEWRRVGFAPPPAGAGEGWLHFRVQLNSTGTSVAASNDMRYQPLTP